MQLYPETLVVVAAPLVAFLVGALKSVLGETAQDRYAVLLTIGVGVLVAALIYAAGLVAIDGLTRTAIVARVVLAGLGSALAASGARSWTRSERAA